MQNSHQHRTYQTPVPKLSSVEKDRCEFCGDLPPIMVSLPPFRENCECSEAVAKRQQEAAERKRQEEQRREEEEMRQYQRRITESGISKRFIGGTLANFDNKANAEAHRVACEYVASFTEHFRAGTGLLLIGDVGRGKTRLATTMALEIMKQRFTSRYTTITGLLDTLKSTYAAHTGRSEHDILYELSECSLLIIDDFGKENPSQWAEEKIFQIINDRYEKRRPLIITTNIGIDDIKSRYPWSGAAIVSRLFEMTSGVLLEGADRRMGARQ